MITRRGVAGKKHAGLPGRVAAADDDDVLAFRQPGLDRRRPVPDAAPLEGFEIGDRRPAVAGATGNHDAARPQRLAVIQVEGEQPVDPTAIERPHRNRDHHLGAELLGLDEGPPGQRLSGNPGRKTEIVLDARAGAGLAAVGPAVEDRDGKTLRSRIDRRCEPRRAGADHGHVEGAAGFPVSAEPDDPRHGAFRRIAQHGAIRADHQRQVRRRWIASRHELRRLGVDGGIEDMVRMAVAGEEIPKPQHVGRMGRADQHKAAGRALDEADPPQDERADDALAEIGLGDQERADLGRWNEDGFHLSLRPAVDQRIAAGELADLGEELPGALLEDRRDVAKPVALRDGDMAGKQHEHARRRPAGFEEQRPAQGNGGPRRTGAVDRFRSPSTSERSARSAEMAKAFRRLPRPA